MNPNLFISRVSLPSKAQDRLAEARAIPATQGINLFTTAEGAEPISQTQGTTMQHQDIEDTKMERSNQFLYSKVIADVTHALNEGADPNHRAEFNDNSPLHQAARNGDVAIAKLLMERGANPNQTVIDNAENVEAQDVFTPLMVASTPEMVAALVEGGADVKKSLWTEQTLDNPAVAHALLEAGMDANAPTVSTDVTNGLPALYACENPEVAKDLVAHGADPQEVIRLSHPVEMAGLGTVQVHDGFLRPDQRYDLDDGANKVIESKGAAFAEAIGTAPGQQFHTSPAYRAAEDDLFLAREDLTDYRAEHPLRAQAHDIGVKNRHIAGLEQNVQAADEALDRQALRDESLARGMKPERISELDAMNDTARAVKDFRAEHPIRTALHDEGLKNPNLTDLETKASQAEAAVNNPKQAAQQSHSPQQKQEAPMQKDIDYNKPMTVEETRAATKHAAPTLGAAVSGATMPKRHSTLGEAAAAATGKSEGEGQGGRQGGQERPSHSSYYNPVPVGGMAMPKRGNTTGDAVIKNEAAVKKSRSMSI